LLTNGFPGITPARRDRGAGPREDRPEDLQAGHEPGWLQLPPRGASEPEAQGDAAGAAGIGFKGGVGEAGVDVRFPDVDAVAAGVGDQGLR